MPESPRYCSWAPERLVTEYQLRFLTATELGAFVALLVEMWMTETGTLPHDPDVLSRYSRLGDAWPQHETKIMSLLRVEDGVVRSHIVDEARDHIRERSEQAKRAVEERERKRREREQAEQGDPPMIGRSSPDDQGTEGDEPSKEKRSKVKKSKEKSSEDHPAFAGWWALWKSLRPLTSLNRANAAVAYSKCLERGARPEDLEQAVVMYGHYLTMLEKTKPDARQFIPMAETWLNQDRWQNEYADEVLDKMVGEPVVGRDFYWANKNEGLEGRVAISERRVLGPNGEKTGIPFDYKAWVASKRGKA